MPDHPVDPAGRLPHPEPGLEVRVTIVEHAVVRIDSHLDRIAGEILAMRSSLERSVDGLRTTIEAGLREQRIWAWSAFRWQLGITLAIGAGLFGMIAHGLKWF